MQYSNVDMRSSADLDLACSIVAAISQKEHGSEAGSLSVLRKAVVSSLGIGGNRQATVRLGRDLSNLWTGSYDEDDNNNERILESELGAVLIWACVNKIAPKKFNFEHCLFAPETCGGVELYEKAFGKLSEKQYRRVLAYSSILLPSGYKVLGSASRKDYESACAAYRCLKVQRDIAALTVFELQEELYRMSALEFARILTGGQVDLSSLWQEDEVSYMLATEILEALGAFYRAAFDAMSEDDIRSIETSEDLMAFADEHDMALHLKYFLDGVPAEDIIA